MQARWVALSMAAAGLLVASSVFDQADARGRGGGSGGGGHARAGGSGHSTGMRSMGSVRAMGIRSGSARVYAGGNALRGSVYHSYGGHRHAHRHHRHHRHRFVGLPPGLYAGYGYYGYYYGDGCEWLRQQALYTGSIYWWDRYNTCISGYGY